jgi:hypothetical protein
MGKQYKVVELKYVNSLIVEGYLEYAVAVYSWVIKELYIMAREKLANVEIEVIKFQYLSAYPAIGIHYKPVGDEDSRETFVAPSAETYFRNEKIPPYFKVWEEIEKFVQVTADRLLEERPVQELLQFIGSSNTDWKSLTDEIMK